MSDLRRIWIETIQPATWAVIVAALTIMFFTGDPGSVTGSAQAAEAATEEATPSAEPLIAGDDNDGPVNIERKPAKLRIGFLAGDSPTRLLNRLEPFRAYLQSNLEIPVELSPQRDWRSLIIAQGNGEIEYGIYGASAYAGAWARCQCVEPLVTMEEIDGSTGYHSVLLVRSGSDIQSIDDMKGKVLAFAGEGSTAGHLVPLAEFRAAGINPEQYFSQTKMADDPLSAIRVLLENKVDGALVWSTMVGAPHDGYGRGPMRTLVQRAALEMADIKVVWRSSLIPHHAHAVHSALPPATKERLRTLLTTLADRAPDAFAAVEGNGGRRFVTIGHAAYQPLIAVALPQGVENTTNPEKPAAQVKQE